MSAAKNVFAKSVHNEFTLSQKMDSTKCDEWIDGEECGQILFKMCKNIGNQMILQGEKMKEKIRAGHTSAWDTTLVTKAIHAVTQSILKGNIIYLFYFWDKKTKSIFNLHILNNYVKCD